MAVFRDDYNNPRYKLLDMNYPGDFARRMFKMDSIYPTVDYHTEPLCSGNIILSRDEFRYPERHYYTDDAETSLPGFLVQGKRPVVKTDLVEYTGDFSFETNLAYNPTINMIVLTAVRKTGFVLMEPVDEGFGPYLGTLSAYSVTEHNGGAMIGGRLLLPISHTCVMLSVVDIDRLFSLIFPKHVSGNFEEIPPEPGYGDSLVAQNVEQELEVIFRDDRGFVVGL